MKEIFNNIKKSKYNSISMMCLFNAIAVIGGHYYFQNPIYTAISGVAGIGLGIGIGRVSDGIAEWIACKRMEQRKVDRRLNCY